MKGTITSVIHSSVYLNLSERINSCEHEKPLSIVCGLFACVSKQLHHSIGLT